MPFKHRINDESYYGFHAAEIELLLLLLVRFYPSMSYAKPGYKNMMKANVNDQCSILSVAVNFFIIKVFVLIQNSFETYPNDFQYLQVPGWHLPRFLTFEDYL